MFTAVRCPADQKKGRGNQNPQAEQNYFLQNKQYRSLYFLIFLREAFKAAFRASWQAKPSIFGLDMGKGTKTLPFKCLCGSPECRPPHPECCPIATCAGNMKALSFQKTLNVWVSDCNAARAHRLIFYCGDWKGKGCHYGLKKAGLSLYIKIIKRKQLINTIQYLSIPCPY